MNGLLDYLSPDEQKMAMQQAQTQGLLGLGASLLQSSYGAPGQPKPRLGQLLSQALPVGMQAYQGGIDQTIKQIALGQQMQEAKRKREQEALRQQQLESFVGTLPADQQSRFRAFPEQAAEAMFREQPESFRQLSDQEKISFNLPANKNFQVSSKTGKISEIGGGGTTVNVPVSVGGKTESKYGETFASDIAAQDVKLRDAAQSAQSQLETIQSSRNLLEEGKVFTGAFANTRLRLAAAGQALGVAGKDTEEIVTNTQRLFANRAKATLDNVKASGLGAGQGFTDRDREFLEKAVLGNIEFTADALKRQLDIEEKVARGSVNKWNTRITQIPKSVVQAAGVTPIELPVMQPAPQAQPTPQRMNQSDVDLINRYLKAK